VFTHDFSCKNISLIVCQFSRSRILHSATECKDANTNC